MRLRNLWAGSALLIIFSYLQVGITAVAYAAGPQFSFLTPADGATLTEGDRLFVEVIVPEGTDVAVMKMYLNDVFVSDEKVAPYTWGGLGQGDVILGNMQVGTYTIRVVATDSLGVSTEDAISITVVSPTVNQAPVLDPIANVTVNAGDMISLSPTARDPDGDALSFAYSGFMTGPTKQTSAVDVGNHSVRVTVSDGQLTDFQDVSITVLDVSAPAFTPAQQHLVRRITFGATPALLEEVGQMGEQAYIDQQLDPASIDDSAFTSRMAGVSVTSRTDLKSWTLLHMIYSKRQLLEVMTWFWDNHFNTDINTIRGGPDLLNAQVSFERAENEAFRSHALGNFRQLLEASAKSPAMLLYLNSVQNNKEDSNENYARELLELHTMGVDGGYTHADIEAGAEIFTGWQLQNLSFFFNAAEHNFNAQTYLGSNIASGGVEQGEQVLDILAAHPSTAQFICKKFVTLFVSDTPPSALVNQCAAKFQATVQASDQIAQVLRLILTSSEFANASHYFGKVKSPLEFVVGIVRVLEGESTGQWLQNHVANIGLNLYENPLPTGWPERAVDWTSTGALLERFKAVEFMLRVNIDKSMKIDLLSYFPNHGANTADAIVDFLLAHLIGEGYPELARQQALSFLNGTNGFSLSDRNADLRLRQLVEQILSYPQFQYQ